MFQKPWWKREVFLFTFSPTKCVNSRWWTTAHYCRIIRKFQRGLWNMRHIWGQAGVMPASPKKASRLCGAAGSSVEGSRLSLVDSRVHIIHVCTIYYIKLYYSKYFYCYITQPKHQSMINTKSDLILCFVNMSIMYRNSKDYPVNDWTTIQNL